jgi:predicted negative regulator of RcsB-dependent stress response
MSLKDDVSRIKEELSTEEQFFTSFFKVEKFYNKYKVAIFAAVFIGLAAIIGSSVMSYMDEKNTIASNESYNKVLENPKDSASLEALKGQNAQLFEIAKFKISQNKTEANSVKYLSDVAAYNKAVAENNIAALDKLIINPDFLLKDFAKFNKALILVEKKDYKKAKTTIDTISQESPVASLSAVVKHYLLTK